MSMLFKRIKDWATSITAFRTGDVIPVDGPNGTAKMSKDDLLKETAENAVDSGVAAAAPTTGTSKIIPYSVTNGEYIDKADGSFVSSSYAMRTDLIALSTLEGKTLSISAGAGYNTCIYAVYGENREFLNSYGKVPTSPYLDWDGELVEVSDILANDPTASYIAFSSWPTNHTRNLSVVEFVRNTIDSIYDELKAEDAEIRTIAVNANPTTGTITDLGLTFYDAYVDKNNGTFIPFSNAHRTDYLDLNDYTGKTFCVSGTAGHSACIYAVYDENKTFLKSYGKGTASPYLVYDLQKIKVSDILANDPTARYVVFGSWPTTEKDLFVGEWTTDSIDTAIVKVKTDNLLYGKKWVACGDSFTQATNLGTAGFDPVMGIYKSYAWWIAQRTGCNLVMMAKSGERIHNDPNSTNKFTPNRYKTIPTDADIITLSFGLNEINVDIGDSSSTDNTTLWGAFNEVLGWIMNNIPKAKVGIIIADGWMPTRIADAERAIAEYWCVPCLDLKYDPDVPLGISGNIGSVPQVRPNTSSLAQAQRNSVFADQSTHPNADAHEYRSTFIEAWMKTL